MSMKVVLFAYVKILFLYSVVESQKLEFATFQEIAEINNNEHLNQCLSNYLVPRVVGSIGHSKVGRYTKSELESLGFKTDVDRFATQTPIFGNLTFSNIIGTFNPNAREFLALACHYDSKYYEEDPHFVGAIDSAVPCCLLLNLAKTLLPFLEFKVRGRTDIGLQLIFFDGEEAFQQWSQHDSLYGSRHLAHKLSKKIAQLPGSKKLVREIDRIEVMVLLDLIGAANTKFHSFYPNTNRLHESLYKIERSLGQNNLLEGRGDFQILKSYANSVVDDDHRPFLEKNVPILHLIPLPFPRQWHRPSDNAAALHGPSIRNMNKILRIFIYKYLVKHEESPEQFQFRFPPSL